MSAKFGLPPLWEFCGAQWENCYPGGNQGYEFPQDNSHGHNSIEGNGTNNMPNNNPVTTMQSDPAINSAVINLGLAPAIDPLASLKNLAASNPALVYGGAVVVAYLLFFKK